MHLTRTEHVTDDKLPTRKQIREHVAKHMLHDTDSEGLASFSRYDITQLGDIIYDLSRAHPNVSLYWRGAPSEALIRAYKWTKTVNFPLNKQAALVAAHIAASDLVNTVTDLASIDAVNPYRDPKHLLAFVAECTSGTTGAEAAHRVYSAFAAIAASQSTWAWNAGRRQK